MSDNILPEEKLLRLIRGRKKQEALRDEKSPVAIPTATTDSKPNLKPSGHLFLQKYLSLLSIRKIIWVVFTISCAYLISSFIYPLFGLKQIKLSVAPEGEATMTEAELKQSSKPYEFYLEGIQKRQIFASTTTQSQEAQQSTTGVDVSADLIKDITLVGIISGENPQAVIEDKKTHKTYYVNKGQFIGEFEVKDIQEGRVILDYKNQNYELYI